MTADSPNVLTGELMPKLARNLLHEAPTSAREDWLVQEPLTVEDWQEVYDAHCAFTVHIRLIVDRARTRDLRALRDARHDH